MTSDRYKIVFSRKEPWSSLGLLRRILRVYRIIFGIVLSSAFLLTVIVAIQGISFSRSAGEMLNCIVLIPCLALLAWCIGCMFIWRGVYRPPSKPTSGGAPPPEPPIEGAPSPTPLRPFTPLILSAHTELPNERST